ncbi:mannitol dehydrogenase family protein [Isoptericola sp. b490]|uniref:mannitol dehydrogenase family protein n=1 Tax=Actinotalea lenta TaxID=3064654 RepID=UPI002713583A|nr:mannitol dehydrogenase family protein [Isoptericola sp. b490]MDO8120332.1 mannitol dehydrogenase family protein [Isoptericola sp. b490]
MHVGLGNFFRAHQAWYTDRAPDADRWGIAAFTGRSASMADALGPQEGLYTLLTRSDDGDAFDVVSSISAVHPAGDHQAWLGYWRSPELAVVTLTITEAGYVRRPDGHLDTDNPDVSADVADLRVGTTTGLRTSPARIVAGLRARRDSGAGPLTVLPCDNLPGNGQALRTVLTDLINLVDPDLTGWVESTVAFGTTMVDRITPATTDEHRDAVREQTGWTDVAPVPTEPFSEWVIQSEFPAGRPAWEQAGALVVDDVEPYEQRKLWMLNGSHSLLAYAATIRGHQTVDQAIADPVCRAWVDEWWSEAMTHLVLPSDHVHAYRDALVARYENRSIRHLLAQIAADGSQKLPVRILPTLRAELAAGRVPPGATRAVAAWVAHLRGHGAPVKDARADEVLALVEGRSAQEGVDAVLGHLGHDLAGNPDVVAAVLAHLTELEASA